MPKELGCWSRDSGHKPKSDNDQITLFQVITWLYLSPHNKARSLSRLIAFSVHRDTAHEIEIDITAAINTWRQIFQCSLNTCPVNNKVTDLPWHQHRDLLSPGYLAIDEVNPCEERLGSNYFQEMQLRTEKEFKTEINVKWPWIPAVKFGEQYRYSNIESMLCFSSSEMFAVAISIWSFLLTLTTNWNSLIEIHAFYFITSVIHQQVIC